MVEDLYKSNSLPNQTVTSINVSQQTESTTNNFLSFLISGEYWKYFTYLIIFVVCLFLFILIYKISIRIIRVRIREKMKVKNYKDTVILEISVPKETAEQVQKEYGTSSQKDSKESLAVGEQLFLLMAEYAKKGFKNWLYGGERFSLEIVCIDQEIRFWLICSNKTADVMERQIIATYPKAHIERLQKTNFFKQDSVGYVQELNLSTRLELPIKTYKYIDSDPLNTLSNALTLTDPKESVAIQLILTPVVNKIWQKKSQVLALKIQQGQNPKEILFPEFSLMKEVMKFFKGLLKELRGKKEEDKKPKAEREIDLTGKKQQISLTPQQQEIIKKLEEKAAKPGFVFTLRIVGVSDTEAKAKKITENVVPAFQIFDIRPFNGFKKNKKINKEKALFNFLVRSPNLDNKDILNVEEINSIWHMPSYMVQNSSIKWLLSRRPPIPLGLPGPDPANVYIGKSTSRGQTKDIYLRTEDRFRHIYSLGGTGSGKTVTMNNVALQDIKMGNGICMIDPHGEAIDDLLRRIPPERIDDVILFSPSITDRPLGLNMLQIDPAKPQEKTLVIDTLFTIWDKLYDLKKTGGPMFENYMKNAMRLVMSSPQGGSTLMEIPKVLVDEDFRAFKLAMCNDIEVIDFWEKEAIKAGGDASLENMVPYITSKLAPFITNDFIKPMIGQQESVINFREAMDNRKIILVSLSKGLIGDQSAYLVGMVIVGGLLMGGMGRSDGLKYNLDGTKTQIVPQDRPPFFVYIDEMQNFLFDAIPKALEEIRKYKVGFYLAHQFVKQVIVDGSERIKDSLMANCGTKIIYRCSADDAKYLESEFYPLSVQDIANPEALSYNAICLVNGQKTTPFNIGARYPDYFAIEEDKELMMKAEKQRLDIIEMVKQKYGRDREEVEREIQERSKRFF